jgi:hypothetical protein
MHLNQRQVQFQQSLQENAEGPPPLPEDSDPVQLEAPRNYHWNFPRQRGALRTVGLLSRLGCMLHSTQPCSVT